jgi:signal transduction histidine kinase
MGEGRELSAVLDGSLDVSLAERVLAAAADAPAGEAVRAALEAVVEIAEADPEETREAIWALRGDAGALERLERGLDLSAERATLALGGAIQLAGTELSSPQPDLRSRMPELLRWLEGGW